MQSTKYRGCSPHSRPSSTFQHCSHALKEIGGGWGQCYGGCNMCTCMVHLLRSMYSEIPVWDLLCSATYVQNHCKLSHISIISTKIWTRQIYCTSDLWPTQHELSIRQAKSLQCIRLLRHGFRMKWPSTCMIQMDCYIQLHRSPWFKQSTEPITLHA